VANLDQAQVNVERIEIRSPVNGWVTSLMETNLEPIRVGDPASIKRTGYSQILRGHVDGIARGINVSSAQPNGQGLANVNPIFTWVIWRSASRCVSISTRCRRG
jgi:multidrug resistance efflux pump